MGKTITLYQPMLQHRTKADLKNALLHLMIHAIIFVKHGMTCLSRHGPVFRDWMDAINACTIEDYLRPKGGYCITTTHDFSSEELQSIQGNLWKCKSCGVTLLRATKLGPPSDSCCIENVSQHDTCGNMLCYWHNHKMSCGGTYVVPGRRGQKMVLKGYAVGCKRGLLPETSETSKSQDAVQESNSDEVQDNSTVAKPIVPATPRKKLKLKQEFVASEKHELFSVGSCNNAKSLGSCSSKKADDFQKAIVSSASPLSKLKRKQTSVASEKHELRSVESFYNAKSSRSDTSRRKQTSVASEKHELRSVEFFYNAKSSRSDTSRKGSRWHNPEHVQKSNVQPAASQKKLKLEKDLTLAETYGVFSLGSCNNAKLPGSSTSRKASKWHKPEGVEKSSVALVTPLKKLKLERDLVDKHGDTKPLGGSTGNKEGKLHKPEGIQKASVLPAAPPRKLKQNLVASEKNWLSSSVGRSNANVLDNVFSKKAHKQREHEETQKPIARPAVFQSKLKQSNRVAPERRKTGSVAPERQKTRSVTTDGQKRRSVAPERKKTRSVARGKKKEYACVSVWANIYESECSSGSADPLVNKRTERRKRERELRSRKRSASGISSIKAQPAEEEVSSQQAKPRPQSQCLDFILIGGAVEVVTQDPRDRSKAPAPRMGILGVPPADQVKTQTPRGQSQLPAQCMDIDIPPADLVTTQTRGDPSVRSTCMDIATVPPSSNPDVIDISDDD